MPSNSGRVDRWLWAVRMFRTRSLAKQACVRGSVRINGSVAKPSSNVKAGDRVKVKTTPGAFKELEVTRILEKRVGPALAGDYYLDHSPLPDNDKTTTSLTPVAKRDRGSGRPTKRDRRRIDKFRGG